MQLYDVIIAVDKNYMNDSRVRAISHYYKDRPDGFGGKVTFFETFTDFHQYLKQGHRMRRRLLVLEEINYQELIRLMPQILESSGDAILLLANHYRPTHKESQQLLTIWQRAQGTTWELAASQLHRLMGLFLKHDDLNQKTEELFSVSQKLVAEKDTEKLLEAMRDAAMTIASADAGTIYTIVDSQNKQWAAYTVGSDTADYHIQFETARNNSIMLSLQKAQMAINTKSVVGAAIQTGKPILIQDTQAIDPHVGYTIDRSFDERTGYMTVSMLTVPFKNRQGKVLGAIQLMNKVLDGQMRPFDKEDVKMVASLAGQAAVALENSHLYQSMNQLMTDYQTLLKQEQLPKDLSADVEAGPLQDAVVYSPAAIAILDAGLRALYVNERFCVMTGFSEAEVMGQRIALFEKLKPGEPEYEALKEQLLKTGKWQGELEGRRQNGELLWVSAGLALIYREENGHKALKYWIAVLEDITTLKMARAQLIHNEKITALGQLAAGMAHEMNTPLGYVGSNLGVLGDYVQSLAAMLVKQSELSSEDRQRVSAILTDLPELRSETQAGLKRMSDIVGALRLISNIDGMGELGSFEMEKSVKAALLLLEPEYKGHCELSTSFEQTAVVSGNPAELNQVVLGLIKNAVDAIKEKGFGQLSVSLKSVADGVMLSVHDTGIGIKPEHLSKVWDPFFTTKPVGSGSGLGLSFARSVIEKHGGQLSLESEYQAYTRVTLFLPEGGGIGN